MRKVDRQIRSNLRTVHHQIDLAELNVMVTVEVAIPMEDFKLFALIDDIILVDLREQVSE